MIISDFLSPDDVLMGVRAPQKRQLLKELAQKIALTLALSPHLISSELLKREDLGSTGTGGGIAPFHTPELSDWKSHAVFSPGSSSRSTLIPSMASP
jgi:mannitol/fructose-specific phosphotransferase system IIA component (Ntr-type)